MPYPIVVDLRGRKCVVIGAGAVAERRILGLIAEGAQVRVVAPQATERLAQLADEGRIEWERGAYSANVLVGATLAFAATDDPEVNEAVARDGAVKSILVCRADNAAAGSFITPSAIRRGDLLIAISTGGKSPTLTSVIRERLEAEFGPEWAGWTALFGRLRDKVQGIPEEPARRHAVIKILSDKEVRNAIAAGDIDAAEKAAAGRL